MLKLAGFMAAVAGVLLTGCSPQVAPESSSFSTGAAASTSTSDTLVVSAPTGTLTADSLVLNNPAGVVWMADRPTRAAGTYSTAMLTEFWGIYGFDQDEPNAILSARLEDGTPVNVAVVTSHPTVTDTTAAFTITPIEPLQGTLPLPITDLTLVIDSSGSSAAPDACDASIPPFKGTWLEAQESTVELEAIVQAFGSGALYSPTGPPNVTALLNALNTYQDGLDRLRIEHSSTELTRDYMNVISAASDPIILFTLEEYGHGSLPAFKSSFQSVIASCTS